MSKRFFVCAVCKRTFSIDPDWSEEDAINEFKQTHPGEEFVAEKLDRICDECFEKYKNILWEEK